MKKQIFAALVVILTLAIVSCDNFLPFGDDGLGDGPTNVAYSPDGNSLTLYLEGNAPRAAENRALSKDLAMFAVNYFEVVFFDQTSPGTTVRASWEPGQSASIKGVPRVAYGTTLNGSGSKAVLFAGRKSDKTLLAIGVLSGGTEAGGGTHTAGTITANTTSVTFSLNALKAGASTTQANSSYQTVSAPLSLTSIQINNKSVPIHQLTVGGTPPATSITYTLDGVAPISSNHIGGIYVLAGAKAVLIGPTISLNGSSVDIPGTPLLTISGSPTITTTPASGAVLTSNAFQISITPATNATVGSIAALTFEVPVNAISSVAATTDGTLPVNWFIRPGYGTNNYVLDEGTGNAGGSLLISYGTAPSEITINSTFPPSP